jgi:hypothetical protein
VGRSRVPSLPPPGMLLASLSTCHPSRARKSSRGRDWPARRAIPAYASCANCPSCQSAAGVRACGVEQITTILLRIPPLEEGRTRRLDTWSAGCGGRGQRRAREGSQRSFDCERSLPAPDERRCCVRQNRVVLAPVAGAKLCGGEGTQPGATLAANSRSDGGKTNSSPGSAAYAVKPLRREGRVASGFACGFPPVHSCTTWRTGGHGCQPAPGLPCALS